MNGIDILHGGGTNRAEGFFILIFHSVLRSVLYFFGVNVFFPDDADEFAVVEFGVDLIVQIGHFNRCHYFRIFCPASNTKTAFEDKTVVGGV